MKSTAEILELDVSQMRLQLDQIEQALGEPAARPFRILLEWYLAVLAMIERKNATIGKLRRLLFGAKTERTREVVSPEAAAPSPAGEDGAAGGEPTGFG